MTGRTHVPDFSREVIFNRRQNRDFGIMVILIGPLGSSPSPSRLGKLGGRAIIGNGKGIGVGTPHNHIFIQVKVYVKLSALIKDLRSSTSDLKRS